MSSPSLSQSAGFDRVLDAMTRCGLLLESDPTFPSVVTMLVGEPVRGSWWGHPAAHVIHAVTGQLVDHEDVLIAKLVSGKVTYIHRRLWPAVLAVATSRESWQLASLPPAAEALLAWLDKEGGVRTDRLPPATAESIPAPAAAARALETRLLIHARQFHSETGAHAKRLMTWERWCQQTGFDPREHQMTAPAGRRAIAEVVDALDHDQGHRADGRLPWSDRPLRDAHN